MRIRFWGTRGSIARPGPSTLRYGGNTPCVEVRADDGTLVVLDAGTGIHPLGQEILAGGDDPVRGHLLISHAHWDHIQGFPFFAPLFVPGNEWEICGPGGVDHRLEDVLAGQMSYPYFPITLNEIEATVRFKDLGEGAFDAGAMRVTTRYANHPSLTLGFRLEAGEATIVYVPDHEPNSLHPIGAAPGARPAHREDRRHVDFLRGADLLIHDAQYTLEEYPDKVGWGHSPFEKAVDFAIAGGAKRLALFHHDPQGDDAAVDRLVEAARRRAGEGAGAPEVFGAAEGQVVELAEGAARERSAIDDASSAWISRQDLSRPRSVLIVDEGCFLSRLLKPTLAETGNTRLLGASDGASAVRIAGEEPPALILLGPELPETDSVELCRILRAHAERRVREAPIVAVTGRKPEERDVLRSFEAGASDFMTKTSTPNQLRSRIHSWLLRASKR